MARVFRGGCDGGFVRVELLQGCSTDARDGAARDRGVPGRALGFTDIRAGADFIVRTCHVRAMITAMRSRDRVYGDAGHSADAPPRVATRGPSFSSLRLHAQGLLASFEAGQPGLVSDRFLDGLGDEALSAVLELCRCGVWARVDDGYQVVSSEAVRMAHEVHHQMRQSATPAHDLS